MSTVGGPRLIPTVPGGSSRRNKTSSVKKSKFSKLLLKPFCQITAELTYGLEQSDQIYNINCGAGGDMIKFSKNSGNIVVYEVVISGSGR